MSDLARNAARDPYARPGSRLLHAQRPWITEDGTSPILHEVVHTALRLQPGSDGDGAIEGLAEYDSLEMLGRSGTVSPERLQRADELLARRGAEAAHLRSKSVSGAGTARAVTVLRALDRRIRDATDQTRGVDDIARLLMREGGTVTTTRMQALAEQVSGQDLSGFFASQMPERTRTLSRFRTDRAAAPTPSGAADPPRRAPSERGRAADRRGSASRGRASSTNRCGRLRRARPLRTR